VIMTSSTPEYQYHLKDHLGNVRMTFTTKDEVDESKATVENENATSETTQFLNYNKAKRGNHAVFDHTYDNTTPPNGTTYAIRLNGSVNERIGLAKSLSVMPGDVLKLEVYAKYYEPPAGPAMGAFATLMAAILGNTASAGVVVDGSGYTTNFATTVPGPGLAGKSSETGTPPKAYLNWLVFDRNYNLLESKSGYKRITTAAKEDSTNVPHERIAPNSDVVIDQAGYAYIYLSNENESPVEVYFDDFKVEHVKSSVIESQDYYPFGLTFNSYQRENGLSNSFKFNGKEEQDELSLNTTGFGWRQYNPAIGRWSVVDQLAEKYYSMSPYTFVANNPINLVDLDGREIDEESRAEWDKQKKSVENRRDHLQKRIDKLGAKAERKGWSAEKLASKTSVLSDRLSSLNIAIAGFSTLENSSQVYSLNKTNGELGGTTYDPQSGKIVIGFGTTANFVHETMHAGQFESGNIAFSTANGQSLGQDVYDEMAAYSAQWGYSPSSVSRISSSSTITSSSSITPSWVQGITLSDGSKPYSVGGSANTGIVPVNISSDRSVLRRAYPGAAGALMGVPSNYTLMSSPATYYQRTPQTWNNLCH
jgi:RHS repeat-associated protein